jgi:hypothetical protein
MMVKKMRIREELSELRAFCRHPKSKPGGFDLVLDPGSLVIPILITWQH